MGALRSICRPFAFTLATQPRRPVYRAAGKPRGSDGEPPIHSLGFAFEGTNSDCEYPLTGGLSSTCSMANLFLLRTVAVCHRPSSTLALDSIFWNQSSCVAKFISLISVSVYISCSFPSLKPRPMKSRGRIPIFLLHIRRPESLYVRNFISYLIPREPLFLN